MKKYLSLVFVLTLSMTITFAASPIHKKTVEPGELVTVRIPNSTDVKNITLIWPDGAKSAGVLRNNSWTAKWNVPNDVLDGDFKYHIVTEYINSKETQVLPIDLRIKKKVLPPKPKKKKVVKRTRKKKERTINLDLRNVELTQVLKLFAKQGDLNILSDKSVTGKVSFSAKGIPVMQALDMVLRANGYSWAKTGNNIVVSFKNPARTFILNFVKADEAQKALQDLLPDVVGISADERLNSVTVRGNLADLEEATKVIKDIDIQPLQVLVEARIIDISLSDTPKLGFGYSYNNIQGGNSTVVDGKGFADKTTDAAANRGFYAMIVESNIEAWLEAIQTDVHTDLLANTKILATNNKSARIITGEKLGYHVREVSDTSTVESVEFLEVGTQLEFTPRISKTGYITMEIKPEVSEGLIVNDLPQETTTEVETEVTVKDGQSIVIGGLIRNKTTRTVSGIPILMDIPTIGNFFKGTSISDEKKETIVVITPHIINNESLGIVKYVEPTPAAKPGVWN